MTRFLADANISPKTVAFLHQQFNFDIVSITELAAASSSDDLVAELGVQEKRVVITQDAGFGQLYFRYRQGFLGVIVLRLSNQSIDSVNTTLQRFFADQATYSLDLDHSLVIIGESRVRVTTRS